MSGQPSDLGEIRDLVKRSPSILVGDLVYLAGVNQESDLGHVLIEVTDLHTLDFEGVVLGDMDSLKKPNTQYTKVRPARWAILQTTGVN